MRTRFLLPLLLALLLVLVPATASAQEPEELAVPTYAPGDFWEYAVDIPVPPELLGGEEEFDLTVDGRLRWTVAEETEVTVAGVVREAYRIEGTLVIEADGSGEFTSGGETATLEVDGALYANHTVHLSVEGLDVLLLEAEFEGNITLSGTGTGFSVGYTVSLNGTVDAAFDYTDDTWTFPLTEGQEGQETAEVTGQSYFKVVIPLMEDMEDSRTFNGTSTVQRTVEGQETVTVPAGSFASWVVNTTAPAEGDVLGLQTGYERAYWADAAGAPVQREFYDGSGDRVATLNLTSYHYAARAGLQILGVDAVIMLPAMAGAVAAVGILVFLLRRRRPPQAVELPAEPFPPEAPALPEEPTPPEPAPPEPPQEP